MTKSIPTHIYLTLEDGTISATLQDQDVNTIDTREWDWAESDAWKDFLRDYPNWVKQHGGVYHPATPGTTSSWLFALTTNDVLRIPV